MSHADRILMGPGPSNPYPQVIKAFGRPVLGHLDPDFITLLDDTNDVEKALAIILGIADGEQKDCANGHVCKAYARLGQANNALISASRIGDEAPFHWRSFYLAECVEVLSGAGAAEDALEFARQIQTDHSRTTALFAVAQSFADSGRGKVLRLPCISAEAFHNQSPRR